jgi:hypothetical protein
MHNKTGDTKEDGVVTIDERTSVSVKVLLMGMGIVLSAIIWVGNAQIASQRNMIRIETKLDMLNAQILRSDGEVDRLQKTVNDHIANDDRFARSLDSRVTVIEESGSKSVHEVQSRINDLEVRMRVMERTVSK